MVGYTRGGGGGGGGRSSGCASGSNGYGSLEDREIDPTRRIYTSEELLEYIRSQGLEQSPPR